jgi:prepilin-type N-terminal cleavage/methylation domain-containing protein
MKIEKHNAIIDENTPNMRRRRRGFTLLELLAVMAIMVMLTTLAVTSYFSAVRGMARRSALKSLVNTLILARQRACMESTRFSVVMFNELTGKTDTDVTPSYIVSKGLGQITTISGQRLIDEFTALDQLFSTTSLGDNYKGAIRLYNLAKGGWSYIYPWVSKTDNLLSDRVSGTTGARYKIQAWYFTKNSGVRNYNEPSGGWGIGDVYGVEAAPLRALPRNFWFTRLGETANESFTVTFRPDGALDSNAMVTIQITEKLGTGSGQQKKATITVSTDGKISYAEKWN